MVKITVTDTQGNEFVSFDEFEDAVAALELVASQSSELRTNPTAWKWVITATQNALQASMVLALMGTDGCGALTDKSQKRNRAWLRNHAGNRPPTIMADYVTLLERVQKASLVEGPPLKPSAEEYRNLERVNELRRQFAHFNPVGWAIELKYLLNVMPPALNAIEHLLTTQDRPQIHFTDGQKKRINDALTRTRKSLDAF